MEPVPRFLLNGSDMLLLFRTGLNKARAKPKKSIKSMINIIHAGLADQKRITVIKKTAFAAER
jgi:hypothetical protein